MNKLQIVIDPSTFNQAKSGSIFGEVYFHLGAGDFFPGRGWSDLAVAFLCDWLVALLALRSNGERSQRVRFFDGPYWVDLTQPVGLDEVSLSFVHDGLSGLTVEFSERIEYETLLNDSVAVGREVANRCQAPHLFNGDVERLTALLSRFPGAPGVYNY